MGRFLNPDNSAFQNAVNSKIYIDKTGLLEYINSVMDTTEKYICNSRPRRFGKSITADMLTAYYSKGCKSKEMFSDLEIGKQEDFESHLNQYDVIHIDIQWFLSNVDDVNRIVAYITESVLAELRERYPQICSEQITTLPEALSSIRAATGEQFVVIIDEWDVLIRDEAANQTVQEAYINFLRGMFKGTEPTRFLHLAYLTGILPIKKLKTQSALNNFEEFTMLDPSVFAPYIGFTEDEVKHLCEQYGRDFDEVKRWYDGYQLGDYQVYNPRAVVSIMQRGTFQSYWSKTGTYEAIIPLISMDFDGLKSALLTMLSGDGIPVKTKSYQNDMVSFKNKDDVMTALIHLGYLAYNQKERTAFIPNEEIRSEFVEAIEENSWDEFLEFKRESDRLLDATLNLDAEAVAAAIEKIHMEYAASITYNDENSLSSVLTIAYLSAMKYYFKPIRELPAGRGFADFVYIPKRELAEQYPALLVELKWDKSAQTALTQIYDKHYLDALTAYSGKILLVGINYDKKDKKHQCQIQYYET